MSEKKCKNTPEDNAILTNLPFGMQVWIGRPT